MAPLWKCCLAEFIGTAFLTATVKVASATNATFAPIAIGFVLTVCIFSYGYISGANFNPSVTTGVMIRQYGTADFDLKKYGAYYVAQILGGIWGGIMALLACGNKAGAIRPDCKRTDTAGLSKCFFSELFFTFLLVTVVLHTATDPRNGPNSFYGLPVRAQKRNGPNSFFGLAIGSVVMIGAFTVGKISGGCFNFAVWVGTTFSAAMTPHINPGVDRLWLFLISPIMGGALAGIIYRFIFFDPDVRNQIEQTQSYSQSEDTTVQMKLLTADDPQNN